MFEPRVACRIRHRSSRSWAGDTLALLRIVRRLCGAYTRGVVAEAIVVGLITGLGYLLIGVEVWLPLAMIVLVGEIVPIIGPWIAFVISLPVILVTQPDKAVLALGLFVAIQILDGLFLGPSIQGRSVRIPFLTTLAILAVGGAFAGPLGAILALPAAALLRDVAFYARDRAGGLSPTVALGSLSSVQREQG